MSHFVRPHSSFAFLRPAFEVVVAKKGSNKSKAPAKGDLPTKVCAVCGRTFTWRKAWAKVRVAACARSPASLRERLRCSLGSAMQVWDEVKYCSERCRNRRNQAAGERA